VPSVRKPNPSAISNVPKPDAPRPALDVPGLHKPYPSDMSDFPKPDRLCVLEHYAHIDRSRSGAAVKHSNIAGYGSLHYLPSQPGAHEQRVLVLGARALFTNQGECSVTQVNPWAAARPRRGD